MLVRYGSIGMRNMFIDSLRLVVVWIVVSCVVVFGVLGLSWFVSVLL